MKTRLRWLWAILLLSLPIFLIVLFVMRDFVRENLVIPVLYMAWMGGLIFNSVPQMYFMGGLIIIGLMLAVGSLRHLLYVMNLPTEPPPPIEEPTRYRFWFKRCQKVNSSTFFLTSLGIELRRFVLMVLAYQEHRNMWDLERQVVNHEFDVPEEIYDLVTQRELGGEAQERSLWSFLLERLRGPSPSPENANGNSIHQRVNKIVSYLEDRLEVEHDRRDS